MRYVSMFSGIGGFENGIENATQGRWTCVGFSEIDKYAIKTYQKHFPNHKNYGDATKIKAKDLPDFDLLCGGFPCQAFSIAGKRLGFQDTRGTLFYDMARIAKIKQPRYLFLENVKGLLNHAKGRTFATILATLDELGYDAEWQVLNSKYFGVPQNRERVFIIGHLRGQRTRQVFPLRKTLKEFIQKREHETKIVGCITARYWKMGKTDTYINQLNQPNHSNDRVYSTDGLSPSINTMQGGNRQPYIQSHSPRSGNPKKGGTGLLESSEHCFTLDSSPHYVNKIRRLTPIECERLQGFPDNWTIGSDTQRYKQCGNAVTVNVIEAIVEQMVVNEQRGINE